MQVTTIGLDIAKTFSSFTALTRLGSQCCAARFDGISC
jgi:hypothetical protein